MKIVKIGIGIFLLSLIACKSNNVPESNQNPIVQKNPTQFDGMRFPKPLGFVNDFEQIFTIEERKALEKRLTEYEKSTTREFVIITVDSIKPYENINDFATDLSNNWGIGKKETDNGLSIVLSKSLGKIRISTGLGTEKILTDEICKDIIDRAIIPEFRNGNLYKGVEKGITELMAQWK